MQSSVDWRRLSLAIFHIIDLPFFFSKRISGRNLLDVEAAMWEERNVKTARRLARFIVNGFSGGKSNRNFKWTFASTLDSSSRQYWAEADFQLAIETRKKPHLNASTSHFEFQMEAAWKKFSNFDFHSPQNGANYSRRKICWKMFFASTSASMWQFISSIWCLFKFSFSW